MSSVPRVSGKCHSDMPERQTLSYLQQKFRLVGLRPQMRFGQNFLIDLNLVELIAKTAELTTRDVVLEVGTGVGSLTTLLAARAGHVVTVEIDDFLAPMAEREFEQLDNVTLLHQDALHSKHQFDARVLAALREALGNIPNSRLKLVGNLPYNVATPIICNFLNLDPWPTRIVVTIQKELAERIVAKPKSKDYSALSIWVQCQAKAEIVRQMPPSVFWPRPKVESAILDIRMQRVLRDRIHNVNFFHDLMRGIFLHRRKSLRSALVSAVDDRLSKGEIDALLQELKMDKNSRAEELAVEDLIELAELVRQRMESRIQ